ncbi:hypothetical protein [Stenotrophomonas phage RAS14]
MTLAAALHQRYLNKLFNSTYKIPSYIQSYQYKSKYQFSVSAYRDRADHFYKTQIRMCDRYLSKDRLDDILESIQRRLHKNSNDYRKTIDLRYELHAATLILENLYDRQ